ncbi:docking protein 1b isoform X1 [Syngnathoides biaculeatus]|uniref:docking protein 1b isoform X1 n=1 Tax=Syngnathoides biaculeatus TaxID=300417 RepID=UPI002ADE8C2E|nr:docking protein 1b isoform X1 [Syngnathoides biaculeatus]
MIRALPESSLAAAVRCVKERTRSQSKFWTELIVDGDRPASVQVKLGSPKGKRPWGAGAGGSAAMDTHIKEGQLYHVQHQKFGKKWKKNWLVLYPASQNGIARLEFFEWSGSGGAGGTSGGNLNEKSRKPDKKIIRLSECISILPALTENCPKENMAAFCVETNDKTHVFATEKSAAKEWMDTMCDIAFQVSFLSLARFCKNVPYRSLNIFTTDRRRDPATSCPRERFATHRNSNRALPCHCRSASGFRAGEPPATEQTSRKTVDGGGFVSLQQGGSGADGEPDGESQDLKMSENLIYYSREDADEFWVSVQRTEASDRCRLAGNYWLKAASNALVLKEPKTKSHVFVWPYKLLRRYGRDRVMFSFESGRRCDSGPGNFTFDTKQGNEIFTLVDRAIKSQKALAEERPLSCPVCFDPECPPSLQHPRNQGVAAPGSGDAGSCSSREADGDSGGSKPGSADGVLARGEGGDGGGGARGQASAGADNRKGRSLPELPAAPGAASGGNTPPRSPRGQGAAKRPPSPDRQAALYSEPVDAVRLPLRAADGLYSDPVDVLPSGPLVHSPPRPRPAADESSGGGNPSKARDLDAHVYDRISLGLSQKTGALSLNGAANAEGGGRPGGRGVPAGPSLEHIYDEPEGFAKGGLHTVGMSVYREARLEPSNHKRQEQAASPSGLEGNYSTPSQAKSSESHKYSAHNRGGPLPPAPKWPKPATAPKPAGKANYARKEPVPSPTGKRGQPVDNVNNNNGGGGGGESRGDRELYGKVSKPARSKLTSPDIIYDNLGNI